ncbi:hypothetical protein BJY01DRAFT_131501 [Aspergillus pseudoustus]|uniref:Uncharacterized protein n=1 Tax=Aspergillus pseudoustus TaxID=1810923 RepID=A0ABR4ILG7_9EURO
MVETGFQTAKGRFTIEIVTDGRGGIDRLAFCSPGDTQGSFVLPQAGLLYQGRRKVPVVGGREAKTLPGGCWKFTARDRA